MTIFDKNTTFKNISLRFFISSSKYGHFWTTVLKTILILAEFPFQQYISCSHLNFDTTDEYGLHSGFLPLWKSRILALVDHFVVCTKLFMEVIEEYKNVKEELSLDSKIFTGHYYRAWAKEAEPIIIFSYILPWKLWNKTLTLRTPYRSLINFYLQANWFLFQRLAWQTIWSSSWEESLEEQSVLFYKNIPREASLSEDFKEILVSLC